MTDGFPSFETPPVGERTVRRGGAVSTAVIELVTAVSDDRMESLPPLYDAIDPDLLDRVFDRSDAGLLVFPYNGHVVSVTGDGIVTLYER